MEASTARFRFVTSAARGRLGSRLCLQTYHDQHHGTLAHAGWLGRRQWEALDERWSDSESEEGGRHPSHRRRQAISGIISASQLNDQLHGREVAARDAKLPVVTQSRLAVARPAELAARRAQCTCFGILSLPTRVSVQSCSYGQPRLCCRPLPAVHACICRQQPVSCNARKS